MSETLHIMITGEEDDLRPRLPARADGRDLKWTILPVLEYERLPVQGAALENLSEFDWLLFTSPRCVHFWNEAILEAGVEVAPETRVACMGPRTAEVAAMDGYDADFVPEAPGTEGFLKAFKRLNPAGTRMLIPQPEDGRSELVAPLSELGCDATALPLYRTRIREGIRWPQGPGLGEMDLLLFTSPSSVRAVVTAFDVDRSQEVACLGQYTERALLEQGFTRIHRLRGASFDNLGELLGELRC